MVVCQVEASETMSSELKTNKVSPATGTALQIGDSGDTITIPSGATLTNSGSATGFGKVLQVVSSTYRTVESTTNVGSFVASGLTATITPTSSSIKILVNMNCQISTSDTNPANLAIYRNGSVATDLIGTGATSSRSNSTTNTILPLAYSMSNSPFTGMDEPSTTSATTYTVYWASYSGTTVMNRPHANNDAFYNAFVPSTLTLMEIAG